MLIYKCKICGGDMEVNGDMTIGTCMYCGSTMTLPKIESEKKARLFNRANRYRLNNEFDKAYDAYKAIVDEDETEAEAYWGMLLSEYGVEYVEDPKTKKRVPTCHRTHIKPIQNTTNYELACKYADTENRFMYQDEAEILDRIQKKIISVSAKEEPYDVFICYKETDDITGERTQDSVLAFDIYEALEKKGIRTFFSRVSLEDKLGTDYEPYIYSALKSARVMLHVTTDIRHSEAVWVKNEWARYLSFMADGEDKTIIPVIKDMSPYELPRELTKYQSQDMSKVGARQDLIRVVEKLLGKEKSYAKVDSKQLNELIEDKQKRERTQERTNRYIRIAISFISLFITVEIFRSDSILLSNGYVNLSVKTLSERFNYGYNILLILGCVYVVCILTGLSIIKNGFQKRTSVMGYAVGTFVLSIGRMMLKMHCWKIMPTGIYLFISSVIATVYALYSTKKYGYKDMIKLPAGILLIAVLLGASTQLFPVKDWDNERNPLKEQILINKNNVPVYKTDNMNSTQMGEVYKGQIFDVITSHKAENAGFTWYKIKGENGLLGFIVGGHTSLLEPDQKLDAESAEIILAYTEELIKSSNYEEAYNWSVILNSNEKLLDEKEKLKLKEMLDEVAKRLYEKADKLLRQGQFENALIIYSKLTDIDYKDSNLKVDEVSQILEPLINVIPGTYYCTDNDTYLHLSEKVYNEPGEAAFSSYTQFHSGYNYEYDYIESEDYYIITSRTNIATTIAKMYIVGNRITLTDSRYAAYDGMYVRK